MKTRSQTPGISLLKSVGGITCVVEGIFLLGLNTIIFESTKSFVESLPVLVGVIFAFVEIAVGVFLVRRRSSLLSVKMRITTAVCVIFPVLLFMATPTFVRARSTHSTAACINNLRQIGAAKQQWAIENNKTTNDAPSWSDILPYLNGMPRCPEGGTYILGRVSEFPKCSIGGPSHSLSE